MKEENKLKLTEYLNKVIKFLKKKDMIYGKMISDTHHKFKDLYEFRALYQALLFNEWYEAGKYEVYKSKKHFNGEECFDSDTFIVVAMLPTGQISNHYKLEYWDLFKIPEYDKSKYKYDGHDEKDVIKRLKKLINK